MSSGLMKRNLGYLVALVVALLALLSKSSALQKEDWRTRAAL